MALTFLFDRDFFSVSTSHPSFLFKEVFSLGLLQVEELYCVWLSLTAREFWFNPLTIIEQRRSLFFQVDAGRH